MKEDTDSITGNAARDHVADRGWYVGGFVPNGDNVFYSEDVEIKYSQHEARTERPEWVTDEKRTTVCTLVSGKIDVVFRDRVVTLEKKGDYVIWGPGIDHTWRAHVDTECFTVRWPSTKKDTS